MATTRDVLESIAAGATVSHAWLAVRCWSCHVPIFRARAEAGHCGACPPPPKENDR